MSRFKNLIVYQRAYANANKIFDLTRTFPGIEMYSLTDQIRRSSRAVCANIAEGYRKRIYVKHFISKISNADAEASETLVWLDFSLDCGYLTENQHEELSSEYEEIGRMLGDMINNPQKYLPKN